MTLTCATLRQQLAYDCRPVQSVNGEPAYEVCTPFSFADGTPIAFYLLEQGAHTLISDNGDVLFHLQSVGLDAYSKRRESTIRSVLQPYGVSLETSGEVRSIAPTATVADHVSKFISAMLAVAAQERAWSGVPARANDFADEVEHYLRTWKPSLPLVRGPKAIGISKHEYEFDFAWGGELVAVVSPNHQATGGLMRKLGDILSVPGDRPRILAVIDDRNDFERADTEKQIIGSLASAMLFTSLQKKASQQTKH